MDAITSYVDRVPVANGIKMRAEPKGADSEGVVDSYSRGSPISNANWPARYDGEGDCQFRVMEMAGYRFVCIDGKNNCPVMEFHKIRELIDCNSPREIPTRRWIIYALHDQNEKPRVHFLRDEDAVMGYAASKGKEADFCGNCDHEHSKYNSWGRKSYNQRPQIGNREKEHELVGAEGFNIAR